MVVTFTMTISETIDDKQLPAKHVYRFERAETRDERLAMDYDRFRRHDEVAMNAHPNAKLNANGSLELQTMNTANGHSFGRDQVEYNFRALVDRTIREQRGNERRLAEQRGTKHQFRRETRAF
jgi:hypothetical protein